MKKVFYFILLILVTVSCSDKNRQGGIAEKGKMQADIVQLYAQIDSMRHQGVVNFELSNQFIEKALLLLKDYPEDDLSLEMLLRAGDFSTLLARNVKDFQPDNKTLMVQYANQSIKIFDEIQRVYPDREEAKKVYYNRAIVYDDILGDYDSAKYEYYEFINRFPNDSISSMLKHYVDHSLGKTPEEILASFE